MPYIGNTSPSRFVSNRAASVYSGDGSTTAFTLEQAVVQDEDILVSVDGVVQEPSVAYAVSNATTLTFTAAPSSNSGNNIFVYYLASQVGTVGHPSNQALSASTGTFTGDVTIGDASAADKKILFDGNAQDFHIGLDDSSDSLTIGLGSALGTTSHMVIDANGHITKPLQSAFHAHKNGSDNNVANLPTDSDTVITWVAERFDQNSDFDLTNNRFVAPVTGRYFLQFHARLEYLDTAAAYYYFAIRTSNLAYSYLIDPDYYDSDSIYYNINFSVLADMDANDTADILFNQSGGTAQTDMDGRNDYTWFAGYLAC